MSTNLETHSPVELRAMLEEMVRRDLLGPAGGPEEEVDERNVRGRYIPGLLAPRGQSILPDEQDELGVDGAGEAEESKADVAIPQTASMLPSAIGLTFTVAGSAENIQITARWGRYHRVDSEALQRKDGSPRRVWKREPVEHTSDPISLAPGEIRWRPEAENPQVYVRGRCRRRDNAWTITLFLVNAQEEPEINKDSAWLFQPELVVRAPDSEPIFVKRQLPPDLSVTDPEDQAMEMLYRRQVEFAVGHGVAVHPTLAEGRWDRAVEIRTEVRQVVLVERLREVRAMVGFTRLDAVGELTDPDLSIQIDPVPLSRQPPTWVPTTEVRGEGIFIQFDEAKIEEWLAQSAVQERADLFFDSHKKWREARYIEHPEAGFPGMRYVLIHSFAHALMRQLALECGYAVASIRERIYARPARATGEPMAGLLIYTSAPDSEGTLGGLGDSRKINIPKSRWERLNTDKPLLQTR